MQCTHCGGKNRKGDTKCFACGEALRMVPDYNPFEDDIIERVQEHTSNTVRLSLNKQLSKELSKEDLELKRRRLQARKKEMQKKQKQVLFLMAIVSGVILGVISYIIYSISYAGIVGKANNLTGAGEYSSAIMNYNKAIDKKPNKIEAYEGLATLYVTKDDLIKAEEILITGVDNNPNNTEMYILLIEFYLLTNQEIKIMPLIENTSSEEVLNVLADYIVEEPKYSLEPKLYEDVQELSLSVEEGVIHYTTDGSEVTDKSKVYTGPIQLSEGTTVVKAITYAQSGIPSIAISNEYIVELPIEGAPIVTPSTGQYNENTYITVQIPTGYTAHYTVDGSVPDGTSKEYTGAIKMPEGNTIFSVVLVNSAGRTSDVTKRNFELVLE